MKASRDWWRRERGGGLLRGLLESLPWRKGTHKPEIIIADSAHAAYVKAAHYYGLRMVVVPVDERTGYRLTAAAVRRKITANTAIVVVSAPSYPHGVCDDIEGIGKLAASWGIACHVDACLGGFILPFARDAGFKRPGFTFSMPGLTSMSIDTHKYGLAHKGTSVVLYRSKEIRKHQFTSITDWSGGLYISPTMAGSRSGAVIAAAWASLLSMGREGFVGQARHLLSLSEHLARRIESDCKDLELLGWPDSTVVAWGSTDGKRVDIYKVNDAMTKRGWHLSALQRPPGLHMCLTAAHSRETVDQLVADLMDCCEEVRKGAREGDEEGMAPMYGMAASLPDRNIVGDVLVAFQEASRGCWARAVFFFFDENIWSRLCCFLKQVALHHLHPRDAVKFLLASLIGGAPSLLLCTFHFATGSVYDSIKNECNLDQLIEPEFPAFFLTGQPELEGGRPCDDFGAAASHGEWRSGGAARPRERARARRAPVPVTKSGLGIFGFLGPTKRGGRSFLVPE